MKLSVIVPVYNGERHLRECIDSVTRQLTAECELIVIDDGSTDGSRQILQDIADGHQGAGEIRVIHLANGGVSRARNAGLSMARGDYVAFLDADDRVHGDYVAALCAAFEQQPDVLEIGYREMDEEGRFLGEAIHLTGTVDDLLGPVDRFETFCACRWYPFLRVIKRNILPTGPEEFFPRGVPFCEDLMAMAPLYMRSGRIVALRQPLYEYRINPLGATRNVRPDYLPPLVAFARSVDASPPEAAPLLVCLAYNIRQIGFRLDPRGGALPGDLSRRMWGAVLRRPGTLKRVRPRFWIHALLGDLIYPLKRLRRVVKA